MPKKTKKEKLLASYHRRIRLLENRQMDTSPHEKIINISVQETTTNNEIKIATIEPSKYFFSDLRKSLLLIIAIIGVEVSLYFAKLIK